LVVAAAALFVVCLLVLRYSSCVFIYLFSSMGGPDCTVSVTRERKKERKGRKEGRKEG